MARRKKKEEEKVIEANLLPVMNIMFLLIPALLMAMEFASMAAINVSPPKFSSAPSEPQEEKKEQEKPLDLKVFIMEDGYRVEASGQQEGADAGKAADSSRPTIPLAKAGAPIDDYERYDFDALEAKAKEYKKLFPNDTTVKVSAESNVPMQVLITTMDSLAGRDCKIGKFMKGTEDVPDNCYFWQPIIEGGAG
ncbi:MAG: biopolymer transporter ExbD [Myxococcales bacterium]|nr:biopolymer transporter ExbD [Myxococcales bacterium]MCB9704043.1 biopolymer transporter ExbD [Myxococcales bacterium]